MNVGRMRYRIEIEELTKVIDRDGFVTDEWIPFATIWADITAFSGKEYIESAQTLSEVTSKIYIRNISGLKTTMRVKWKDRILNIQSILIDERHRFITIMAREVL